MIDCPLNLQANRQAKNWPEEIWQDNQSRISNLAKDLALISAFKPDRFSPNIDARPFFIPLTLRGLVLMMVISTLTSVAASANSTQSASCSKFRNGTTMQEEIAIFLKWPVEDPKAYQLKTMTFRQEYVHGVPFPPNTDGLPTHGRTFGINIDDGQPLSEETQQGEKLLQAREVMLDVEAKPSQSLTLSLRADAYVPITPEDGVGGKFSPREPVLNFTGNFLFDYEQVHVERGTRKDSDFYAKRDASGKVIGTLVCYRPGSVPFPQCTLSLKDENFFIKVDGVRVTFESDLAKIEQLAQDFATCLLRDGK